MSKPYLPFVVACFLVVCGFGVLSGTRPSSSGMKLNGHVLSKDEAEEGLRETVSLMESAGDDSVGAPDLPEPKTEMARRFAQILRNINRTKNSFAERVKDFNVDEVISAKRLTSAEGRKRSRRELSDYRIATETLFMEVEENDKSLASLLREILGRDLTDLDTVRAQDDQQKALMLGVVDLADRVIDATERAKPRLDTDGAMIVNDRDLPEIRRLFKQLDEARDELMKKLELLEQKRRQTISDAFEAVNALDK